MSGGITANILPKVQILFILKNESLLKSESTGWELDKHIMVHPQLKCHFVINHIHEVFKMFTGLLSIQMYIA